MILSIIHCDTTEHMVEVVRELVSMKLFHTVSREGPHGWKIEIEESA